MGFITMQKLRLILFAAAVATAAMVPGGAVAQLEEDAAAPAVAEDVAAAPAGAADEVDPGDLTDIGGLDGEGAETDDGSLDYTFLQLIQFGGVVGYIIIFLSLVAVALIIDDLLLLRRKVLLPADEIEELRDLVESGRGAEVVAGAPRSSFVGAMAVSGLREMDRGYEAVVKGMEDAADEVAGRLLRRIEYLNVIANVAPMLGLLGTVIGMVACFNQISVSAGGADPRLLAAGIFQALMTTVMGLTVAIPAFFAFSLFRNRVDALAAEAAARAEDVMSPLRPVQPVRPRAVAAHS
jgi:biopolymer transport protein ExbB